MDKNSGLDKAVYSSEDILSNSVAGKDKNFFVNTKKKKVGIFTRLKQLLKNKKTRTIIIIIVAAVVVIALALLSWLVFFNNDSQTDDGAKNGDASTAEIAEGDDEDDDDEDEIDEEDIAEEITRYEEKINATGDPEEQTTLYLERAMYLWDIVAMYERFNYDNQILSDLNSAESLEHSARTAYDLCLFLEDREDLNPDKIDYCSLVEQRDSEFFKVEDESDGEG